MAKANDLFIGIDFGFLLLVYSLTNVKIRSRFAQNQVKSIFSLTMEYKRAEYLQFKECCRVFYRNLPKEI